MTNTDKNKVFHKLNQHVRVLIAAYHHFNKIQGSVFSAALAIQFFIAILPLVIVVLALLTINRDHNDIGYLLIRQFDLQGPTAQIVGSTFATVEDNYRLATLSSLLTFLIFSYGLVRTMQLVFAHAWKTNIHSGRRGLLNGICWLGIFFVIEFAEDFLVVKNPHWILPTLGVTIVGTFFLWIITPKLLVTKSLSWKDSLPTAIIGTIFLILFRVAERYFLSDLLNSYAVPFGGFGVSFALIIWLWVFAYTWVWVAVHGAAYFEWGSNDCRLKID